MPSAWPRKKEKEKKKKLKSISVLKSQQTQAGVLPKKKKIKLTFYKVNPVPRVLITVVGDEV